MLIIKFRLEEPIEIPSLTERLLSCLEPRHVGGFQSTTCPRTSRAYILDGMPLEIIDIIISYLQPSNDLPPQCTYMMAPLYWRRALVDSMALPWLWDLDIEAVFAKESSREGVIWDWEMLFRQLSQVTAFEPGNPLEDVNQGLRNRRRIWRIVEDMRTDEFSMEELKD